MIQRFNVGDAADSISEYQVSTAKKRNEHTKFTKTQTKSTEIKKDTSKTPDNSKTDDYLENDDYEKF